MTQQQNVSTAQRIKELEDELKSLKLRQSVLGPYQGIETLARERRLAEKQAFTVKMNAYPIDGDNRYCTAHQVYVSPLTARKVASLILEDLMCREMDIEIDGPRPRPSTLSDFVPQCDQNNSICFDWAEQFEDWKRRQKPEKAA